MNIDFSKGITKTVGELSSTKTDNNSIIKMLHNKHLFGIFKSFYVLFEDNKEIYLKLYVLNKQVFCASIKF